MEQALEAETNGIDHISNLPDSVLSHILTKLPTKYAVSTTVLSTRWKDVLRLIPLSVLELDDTLISYPPKRAGQSPTRSASRAFSFIKFAYKMFNVILEHGSVLTHLRLKCREKYEDVQILHWVESALQLCIQVLDIDTSMDRPELFFIEISGRQYPLSLTLHQSLAMHVPSSFSLPNLEDLRLDRVFFQYGEEISSLLSGCSVIKSLSMPGVIYEGADDLHISLPSLQRLSIEQFEYYVPVTFDTPALEFLYFKGYMGFPFVLRNLNSIREAHICYEAFETSDDDVDGTENMEFDEYASALVRSCFKVNKLFLSKDTISALQRSREALPILRNLTSLDLGGFDTNGWRLLPRLLRNAPKLEVLIISEEFYTEEGCFERFMSDAPCGISNLQKVEILKAKGVVGELNLIEYLLAVGKGLKSIEITCHNSLEKCIDRVIIEKMLKLSDTCQILTCHLK